MSEWNLFRGDDLLGVLRLDGQHQIADYPSLEAAFEPTASFEDLRPMFDRELALLDVDNAEENEEWADLWDQILAPGLFVVSPDGNTRIAVSWVHFKAGRAWWFPLYNDPAAVVLRRDGP